MPELDPKVAIHYLFIKEGISPKKHPQRPFHPELVLEIEKEVIKLIKVAFIHKAKYATWIANITLIREKRGQHCMCVDM